ncbi:MAG: ATP-binding protein [Clostridiales bacterium]|jgi:hypothetical protein|nr:ATP-binding protein [Clostridiales bacterium]
MSQKDYAIGLGMDDFSMMRRENNYYIDKSLLVKTVVEGIGYVKLITRPRRFGKSTNMSMLRAFFEIGKDGEPDPKLFEGLAIEGEKGIFDKWYRKYPVIHLNLFPMSSSDEFNVSIDSLRDIIASECERLHYLQESSKVSESKKNLLRKLENNDDENKVPLAVLIKSLSHMTKALADHHGKPVIVLIDEYDSPFNHKSQDGFRDKLLSNMSVFFGCAFKGNPHVRLNVVTGCLRIANESIFTGANNLVVYDLDDNLFSEFYGLTQKELEAVLWDKGLPKCLDDLKAWYDGYNFGGTQIYNTSSVLHHIAALIQNRFSTPKNYWINTSRNDILETALDGGYNYHVATRLVAGEAVSLPQISHVITYRSLKREDSIWSILYSSGYLTKALDSDHDYLIPNAEVKSVFVELYKDYVKGKLGLDKPKRLHEAIYTLDAKAIEGLLKELLLSMSFHDTGVNHEDVYHDVFFGAMFGLNILSNREAGHGRADVEVEFPEDKLVVVFEFKRIEGKDKNLSDTALRAYNQVFGLGYIELHRARGFKVAVFGVGCSGKNCKIVGGLAS